MNSKIEVIELSSSNSSSPMSPPPMDPMFGEYLIDDSSNFNYNPSSDGIFLNFSPVSSPLNLDDDVENLILNDLELNVEESVMNLEGGVVKLEEGIAGEIANPFQEFEFVEVNEENEVLGMEEENEEEAVSDSGYDSFSDKNISSEEELSEKKYDPFQDPIEEAKLHRILELSQQCWRLKAKLLRLKKNKNLKKIKNQINILAERRKIYMNSSISERRKVRKETASCMENPRRGIDRCFGCAKVFWLQKVRRWVKCEECGSWLCPNCSEEPDHCWSDGGLL